MKIATCIKTAGGFCFIENGGSLKNYDYHTMQKEGAVTILTQPLFKSSCFFEHFFKLSFFKNKLTVTELAFNLAFTVFLDDFGKVGFAD